MKCHYFSRLCDVIFLVRLHAGGNVKLITHGSERVKLSCVPM